MESPAGSDGIGQAELEAIETLAHRIEFVEELQQGPLHKPDLVERLAYSRSTVDRAIEELEAAGLVERVTRGWTTTRSGRLAAEQYESFLDATSSVIEGQAVIDTLPAECDPPPSLVEDGDVEPIEGPYELCAQLAELLETAAEYRIVLPQLIDSRHVRLWHSQVVRGEQTIELLSPAPLLDGIAEEFPQLTAELAANERFAAREVETPSYGLVLASTTEEGSDAEEPAAVDVVVLVAYGEDGVEGTVTATSETAREWAVAEYDRLRGQGADATGRLRSESQDSDVASLLKPDLPSRLRAEGFVELDESYLESRPALPPETAWRAGIGLPEVAAGHAVERHLGDGTTVAGTVRERLADGADVAVIGPAGSGKSTVCKRVADEWYRDEGTGRVLYREGGAGDPFQSTAALAEFLQQVTEPTLVVVEDAIRSEAAGIFETMRTIAGAADVSVLLDAVESEWHDPPELPSDARLDAYRRDAVDVVSMPALDETEARRLLAAAESVFGQSFETEPEELLAAVRPSAAEDSSPGAMLLLSQRLATQADPLAEYENGGTTALEADVDAVRTDLAGIGSVALDAGVLANALNAAGIELTPELLYPVALDDPDQAADAVAAALDRLEGHVLFERGSTPGYRGIHESWSVAFLERLVESEGKHAARERFGRCLSALFALADEPGRCDRLDRLVAGPTPALERIVTDPTGWADDVVETLFQLGDTHGGVAPLFGTSEGSAIELPAACSPEMEARCAVLRTKMFWTVGDVGRVREEADRAATLAADHGDRSLEATAIRYLGRSASERSEYDRARERYEETLAIAREIDDTIEEATALKALGMCWFERGDDERAREYLNRGLDRATEYDHPRIESSARNGLAMIAWRQGDYERAREQFQRSREIERELGRRLGQAEALGNLGSIAAEQGEYGRARERFRRSLALVRESGARASEAIVLHNLGEAANQQGRYGTAKERLERSLAIDRELDNPSGRAANRNMLGKIARNRGEYERAREHYEASLDIARDLGEPGEEASTLLGFAILARRQQEYDRAHAKLDRALTLFEERGDRVEVATCHLEQGRLALAEDDIDAAREAAERARDIFESLGVDHQLGRSQHVLGRIAARDDNPGDAREYWRAALATLSEVDAPQDVLETLEHLVEHWHERGDDGTVQEWCRRARETLADAPDPVVERHREWVDRYCPE